MNCNRASSACAGRLGAQHALAFGTLEPGCDVDLVLSRVLPESGGR